MALENAEKMACKQILELPDRHPYLYADDDPDTLLAGVSAAAEAEIRESILPAWEEVKNDTDTIQSEGLDSDPARTRARLKKRLALLIGYKGLRGAGGRRRVLR